MSVETAITLSAKGIAALSERLGEPEWLRAKRLSAFEAYERMALPTWDRTDLAGLNLDAITIYQDGRAMGDDELPEALKAIAAKRGDEASLFFQVDGQCTWSRPKEELAAKGVIVCDFQTALKEHEELLRPHYMSAVGFDEDKLTALHYAAVSSGWFIYVPKNTVVEAPIELRSYGQTPGLGLFSHILVVAEQGAEVTVVHGAKSDDGGVQRVVANIVEICPKEGAQVRFYAMQDWGRETYNYTLRRSVLARDARTDWYWGDFGSRLSRSHIKSILSGTGSESYSYGVFFGDGEQHLDLGITMLHEGEHTASDMESKGILDDRARVVYRGLTDIENGARFASGFQRENTMLLSEEARSDAIPGLEIDETEVQAGHAATTGQVDPVQLFYLMSRGLRRHEALYLLVVGFLEAVLGRMPLESFREELAAHIDGKMAG